jgi:hypothetical protein
MAMCDICDSLTVNTYLADRLVKRYEVKETAMPGFLASKADPDEVDEVLSLVHYGNSSHAFFSGAGVNTYRDLVNRLSELTQPPVIHD